MNHLTDGKPWYQSRSIMGALVAMLAMLAGTVGVAISPEIQNEIVTTLIALAGVIGTGVSIYGRVKAEKPIRPPSAREAGKMVVAAVLVGGLAVGGPVGCASYLPASAEQASPEQSLYALQADYNAALASAVAYVESGAADADAVATLRRLDAVAYGALMDAQVAARDGNSAAAAAALSAGREAITELRRYLVAAAGEQSVTN